MQERMSWWIAQKNVQWTLFGLANDFVLSHKISNLTVDFGDCVVNSTASQVNVSPNNCAFDVTSLPSMVNLQVNRFWRRKCPVTRILALMDFLVPDAIRISFWLSIAVNFGQKSGPAWLLLDFYIYMRGKRTKYLSHVN